MKKRTFCKSFAGSLLMLGLNPRIVFAEEQSKVFLNSVYVNNKSVTGNLASLNNDVVETKAQQAVIKVQDDAFLIRPNSKLRFTKNRISEVISGSVHAAFGKKSDALKVKTTYGTISIRGTVTYIEVENKFDRTYVCNCYGHTDLYNNSNQLIKSLKSDYHSPAVMTAKGTVENSPYNVPLNHYDDHIEKLEEAANRQPRWKLPKGEKIFISPTAAKINF
jgi:hypothetical protein